MDHFRGIAHKAALAVALTVFAANAQAEVIWEIVGTAVGEPDLTGTAITNDIPVSCSFGPPAGCPISGTLTIPADALGGPGTTIDLGADPEDVIISISTSPPTSGDDFFLFTISKDGYDCNASSSFVLQCDFDSTTAFYNLVLTEQVPQVSIGNGNVLITGEFQVNGQAVCSGECSAAGGSAQKGDPACNDNSDNIYVDCNNGTVTDNRTKLIWLADATCFQNLKWQDAMLVVSGLSDIAPQEAGINPTEDDCGLSDNSSPGEWRLPSASEWKLMIDDALGSNGDPDCTVEPPTITNDSGDGCLASGPSSFFGQTFFWANLYWSTTTSSDSNSDVWAANLNLGTIVTTSKTALWAFWPVRDGQ